MSHFITSEPNIIGNAELREPQIQAYMELTKYYGGEYTNRETVIVLPTGTGKTGLMGIAPYGISKGKVLIITPQTIVRNTVINELDPYNPLNFYLSAGVFNLMSNLPSIIQFDKTLSDVVLEQADIVVLNIHKLQERLDSSLLKRVPTDFFDMIIIDEAHHAEARTWKNTIEYFDAAKIIKMTGTPFRSDGVKLSGEELYSYPLSMAMANGYVKSLERFTYTPDQMQFTIKGSDELHSLEDIKKIKDEEWISRSVALSVASNKSIIDQSIEKLKQKKLLTGNNPHKIVAVACSIEHAEQIHELYQEAGLRSVIVHSKVDKFELQKRFKLIDTHNVDVVVNVALLGEGYDHRFLSIAAIFRPYRSDLPYQQFIGRVLRSTSSKDGFDITTEDNIAEVIHHQELNLDHLWEEYKKELKKRDTIKEVKKQIVAEKKIKPTARLEDLDYGLTQESDELIFTADAFLDTALIQERERKIKESEARLQKIMSDFKVPRDVAIELNKQIDIAQNPESRRLLRPDLYEKDLKNQLSKKIVQELVPDLLLEFDLDVRGMEIAKIKNKFIARYAHPPYNDGDNNGAILAKYFNVELKKHIDAPRDDWAIGDFERAIKYTENIENFLRSSLRSFL